MNYEWVQWASNTRLPTILLKLDKFQPIILMSRSLRNTHRLGLSPLQHSICQRSLETTTSETVEQRVTRLEQQRVKIEGAYQQQI